MTTLDPKQLDFDFSNSSTVTSTSDDCYTISIDPSLYSTSITSPCVVSWSLNNACYTNTYATGSIGIGTTYTSGGVVRIDTDGIKMEEGTDIKIGKQSLTEVLTKLEERLNILHHNPELENKWDELKELGERYRSLEKELIEKEKMWKILKDA